MNCLARHTETTFGWVLHPECSGCSLRLATDLPVNAETKQPPQFIDHCPNRRAVSTDIDTELPHQYAVVSDVLAVNSPDADLSLRTYALAYVVGGWSYNVHVKARDRGHAEQHLQGIIEGGWVLGEVVAEVNA